MGIRKKIIAGPRVRETRLVRKGRFRFDISVPSGYVVPIDEIARNGGDASAPTGNETLTASLSASQSIQMVKVAEALAFYMENLDVACSTTTESFPSVQGNKPVSHFTGARIDISFVTDELPERIERLKTLAVDCCPIGRLFTAAGIAPQITITARPR
jgi:uncharacterized OsmC-like protein